MRQRVDGHKFEAEFAKEFSKEDLYLIRLHTPSSGYTGLTQPADFILATRKNVYLVELKETGADAFSCSNVEQAAQIEKFERFIEVVKPDKPITYVLLVHFISRDVIKSIEGKDVLERRDKKKPLRFDDSSPSYRTLIEVRKELFE